MPADGDLYLNYDADKLANDNQLAYTFTWTQPGEAAASGGNTKYKLTLYGVTETRDENGNVISTAEETITLPDDANSKVQYKDGTYSYTLPIDTDLAGGSNSWRFDKVRLRVTRDTTGTTQGIGAADTAVYTVRAACSRWASRTGVPRGYQQCRTDPAIRSAGRRLG